MPSNIWIHQTDLFRPHADPDDHWDLACVSALAAQQHVQLKGLICDHPPAHTPPFNPDVIAVSQINHLYGLATPFVTGSSFPFARNATNQLGMRDGAAVRHIVHWLEESASPVVIHIVGSCRDIALALDAAPQVFAKKCAGIYLNAGQGAPDPKTWVGLEYNVAINASAYQAIFAAPCPVYWIPCYFAVYEERSVRDYASWWDFEQGAVLPDLSQELQNYFLSVLSRSTAAEWLSDLSAKVNPEQLEEHSRKRRNMWCTAGFLHAAGFAVTRSGEIVSLEAGTQSVFGFEHVEVSCDDAGQTRWASTNGGNRLIFRVYDTVNYAFAMTQALRTLLRGELSPNLRRSQKHVT